MFSNLLPPGAWDMVSLGGMRWRRSVPLMGLLLLAAGCSHLPSLRWPWVAKAAPPAAAVRELDVIVPSDASMPIVLQYWHRNALLVDLEGVASQGALTLQPRAGQAWPVRLEFRVVPGRFAVLEVKGEQRVLFPVSSTGTGAVVLALDPSAYDKSTPRIELRWGPTQP